MNIGLFFGSFNPVHHGHLIIASHILNEAVVDKIWFVVSPHNPLKETKSLLNENQRYYLTDLAVADNDRLRVTDVEFSLERPLLYICNTGLLNRKVSAAPIFCYHGWR
jgi:nicotinate-nucleotide adenylyltransferase